MKIKLHPHAKERLIERGATETEIRDTIATGEIFPAKFGRTGFRKNFSFGRIWREKIYATKQVEVYAIRDKEKLVSHYGCNTIFLGGFQ
jgi:hypothetical protein